MDWKRIVTSAITAFIISVIVFLNLNDFGITWDEPIYFARADHYFVWLKTPRLGTAQDVFRVTTADYHPPFRKLVGGLTHEIFVNQFHLIDNTRGYRISALLFVFPFVLLFTYIAIGQFGYCIGILTPYVFSFMPHVFFLTPLMTTDYAMAVMWFTAVVVLVKGFKNSYWLPVTAVLSGFVFLTKLYGVLIILPLVGYWIWKQRNILFKAKKMQVKMKTMSSILFVLMGCAATYVVFWPWLWSSPIVHFVEYLMFQLTDAGVPVAVFGQTYTHAPYWYTLVMLLLTTPIFVLVFFAIGILFIVKKGKEWDWVFLLNALFPLVFFSLPGVYRYDGIRLFLISFPFICLVAARGIQSTVKMFTKQVQPYVVCVIFIFWIGTVYTSVIGYIPGNLRTIMNWLAESVEPHSLVSRRNFGGMHIWGFFRG